MTRSIVREGGGVAAGCVAKIKRRDRQRAAPAIVVRGRGSTGEEDDIEAVRGSERRRAAQIHTVDRTRAVA